MKQKDDKQVKVTYATKDQRHSLLLKEAFQRDLVLFQRLLNDTPQDWTLTVISSGSTKELFVNIPAKKPSKGLFEA